MANGTKAFAVAALMALVAISASQGQAFDTRSVEMAGEGRSTH